MAFNCKSNKLLLFKLTPLVLLCTMRLVAVTSSPASSVTTISSGEVSEESRIPKESPSNLHKKTQIQPVIGLLQRNLEQQNNYPEDTHDQQNDEDGGKNIQADTKVTVDSKLPSPQPALIKRKLNSKPIAVDDLVHRHAHRKPSHSSRHTHRSTNPERNEEHSQENPEVKRSHKGKGGPDGHQERSKHRSSKIKIKHGRNHKHSEGREHRKHDNHDPEETSFELPIVHDNNNRPPSNAKLPLQNQGQNEKSGSLFVQKLPLLLPIKAQLAADEDDDKKASSKEPVSKIIPLLGDEDQQAQDGIINGMKNYNMKFRLSARYLPNKDVIGKSDPYVIFSYADTEHKDKVHLGETSVVINSENPTWGEVFGFNYDKAKNQKWHFAVYDRDVHGKDDLIGTVWVKSKYYIEHGEFLKLELASDTDSSAKSSINQAPLLIIQKA